MKFLKIIFLTIFIIIVISKVSTIQFKRENELKVVSSGTNDKKTLTEQVNSSVVSNGNNTGVNQSAVATSTSGTQNNSSTSNEVKTQNTQKCPEGQWFNIQNNSCTQTEGEYPQ